MQQRGRAHHAVDDCGVLTAFADVPFGHGQFEVLAQTALPGQRGFTQLTWDVRTHLQGIADAAGAVEMKDHAIQRRLRGRGRKVGGQFQVVAVAACGLPQQREIVAQAQGRNLIIDPFGDLRLHGTELGNGPVETTLVILVPDLQRQLVDVAIGVLHQFAHEGPDVGLGIGGQGAGVLVEERIGRQHDDMVAVKLVDVVDVIAQRRDLAGDRHTVGALRDQLGMDQLDLVGDARGVRVGDVEMFLGHRAAGKPDRVGGELIDDLPEIAVFIGAVVVRPHVDAEKLVINFVSDVISRHNRGGHVAHLNPRFHKHREICAQICGRRFNLEFL